jgi:two-component system sensor histidine kinase KdpD
MICEVTPQDIVDIFEAQAAAIFIAEQDAVFCSVENGCDFDIHSFKVSVHTRRIVYDCLKEISYVPLCLGTGVIGSAAVVGTWVSSTTLESLGALIAIGIERARKVEQVGKIEALRETEALKTALVDAITHEFRTPLTAVKASATLRRHNPDFNLEQREECVAIIDEGCDSLNQLIEEVSQMSRLESRDVRLQLAPHSISDLVHTAFSESRNLLGSRPLELHIANKETAIRIDLFWANKILTHLLVNAALYSTPGTPITVRTEAKNGLAYFHVEDQGPGIGKEEVNLIFEKFYRGKEHRCSVHGTGMGLPIAKAITEAHGGTLTVVSSLGKGSVFSFSLPVDRRFDEIVVIPVVEDGTPHQCDSAPISS